MTEFHSGDPRTFTDAKVVRDTYLTVCGWTVTWESYSKFWLRHGDITFDGRWSLKSGFGELLSDIGVSPEDQVFIANQCARRWAISEAKWFPITLASLLTEDEQWALIRSKLAAVQASQSYQTARDAAEVLGAIGLTQKKVIDYIEAVKAEDWLTVGKILTEGLEQ